jgi:Tol biopolymer transport system component
MRTKNLIIGLVSLLLLVVVLSMSTKSQKPEEQPKFEVVEIGTGGAYRWSPDGTKLAFLTGGWLCVANVDGKLEVQKIVEIKLHGFEWMSDSEFVVWISEPWRPKGKALGRRLRIETVDMKGQVQLVREDSITGPSEYLSWVSPPFVLKDGTVGYYEIHEKPDGETKILKIIKQGKLKPEEAGKQMRAFVDPYPSGDIWVEHVDGTVKKKVTSGERKYIFPQLSPDNTKIVGHHYGLGMSVLDLQGNLLADFGKDLPKVPPGQIPDIISASWSPDSKKIAYDLIVESEDTTYSRDIYIVNFDGTSKIKIPDIPGELIGGPAWSPDGTKIVCRSESGKIFVIKVK